MKAVQLKVAPAPPKTATALADFDNFVKAAQFAVGTYSQLNRTCNQLHDYCSLKQIEEAEHVLADFERYDRKKIEECDNASATFEPDSAYDDNGITKAQVSKHVSMLLGSFPNANPSDPEVYTMMLIEEILAASPSVITLESACRTIRRTNKFLPTVSEMLTAISDQQGLWAARWTALECCTGVAQVLRDKITVGKARLVTEEAERARRKAKAQPIAAGDRVRHARIGPGTVTELRSMLGGYFHFNVAFDEGSERYVAGAAFLERLVEGEEGFQPAVATMQPEATP